MKTNSRLDTSHVQQTREPVTQRESSPLVTASPTIPRRAAHPSALQDRDQERTRSALKEKLIEVERGITQGFRLDSTFFVHFFVISILAAAGIVFGLGMTSWCLMTLSVSMVLAAQMFNQVLKIVWSSFGHQFDERTRQAARVGSAGVFVTILGAVTVIGTVFVHRLLHLYGS